MSLRLITMANGGEDGIEEIETGVATRTKPKTKKPSNYKVLMLNDDYTPMEFVVLVLQRFFSMGIEDATRVMLQVHQQGVAVCGVFTYEVAETKVTQVIDFARASFDRAVAESSKLTESLVKLAGEAFQPLSNRASANAERFNTLVA